MKLLLVSLQLLMVCALAQSWETLGHCKFINTADGVRIHRLDKGTGPAILFVPGWTMPAEIWEDEIVCFAKDHHVVAMDPRSQGRSSARNEGHYPAARARDIKAVVDELKLAPVVLVGWSLGAPEVVAYVEQFGTQTVQAIVLVEIGLTGGRSAKIGSMSLTPVSRPVRCSTAGRGSESTPSRRTGFAEVSARPQVA